MGLITLTIRVTILICLLVPKFLDTLHDITPYWPELEYYYYNYCNNRISVMTMPIMLVFFGLAAVSSISLIFGVLREISTLLIPYLVVDAFIIFALSFGWLASFFCHQPIIFAYTSILLGEC